MSAENLWGGALPKSEEKLPLEHFRDQAEILTRMTQGVITGNARASVVGARVNAELTVTAAVLNYSLPVAEAVYHLAQNYPCRVIDPLLQKGYEVKTEKEFLEKLGQILQSEKVQRTVASLMRSAQAASG